MPGFTEGPYLGSCLRNLPYRFRLRYSEDAAESLRRTLFQTLIDNKSQHWTLLFPDGVPDESQPWRLSEAQGVTEGTEYTAAARGFPCGHIFRPGEVTYHCRTCQADDTCVLCTRCFNESDHQDHDIGVGTSGGGCCDCGDEEAWVTPVHCSIHRNLPSRSTQTNTDTEPTQQLPDGVEESVKGTIALALDYVCDVFSCAPEQQRQPKTADSVQADENRSRLRAPRYSLPESAQENIEWAMVVWNDEKHTVQDVENQVAQACRTSKSRGYQVARETDDRGRCIVHYSHDLPALLGMVTILERLQLSVTVRSSRDVFREEMCSTIIEWLYDIAGCKIGQHVVLLRKAISEAMLSAWNPGSPYFKVELGKAPLYDHESEDQDRPRLSHGFLLNLRRQIGAARALPAREDGTIRDDGDELEDEDDNEDDNDDDDGMGDGDIDSTADTEDRSYTPFPELLNGMVARVVNTTMIDRAGADTLTNTTLTGTATFDADIDFRDETVETTPPAARDLPLPPSPGPAESSENVDPSVSTTWQGLGEQTQNNPAASPQLSTASSVTVQGSAKSHRKRHATRLPPAHWFAEPDRSSIGPLLPAERLSNRLRLDCLIICDMRLWKTLRDKIRDLCVHTLIVDPEHKRLLALRLAALFTDLSRLFLIADREFDHSIMQLAVQLFTTPSITADVMDRANLLTRLLAILYTFMTSRKVGYPGDVKINPDSTIEASATANKRVIHLWEDARYMLQSHRVHERIRVQPQYILQFLDLVQMQQGIWPATRAVGEHVAFEADGAQTAFELISRINGLCRLFAEAYADPAAHDCIAYAIRETARIATVNSLGQRRFKGSEFKEPVVFHDVQAPSYSIPSARIPKVRVLDASLSFQHPIHHLLAWLLQNCKHLPCQQVQGMLLFDYRRDLAPLALSSISEQNSLEPSLLERTPAESLTALFDISLRVCVWASQIRAHLWVRNGYSLRQQLSNYRMTMHRELTFQKDFYMLQAGFVLCDAHKPAQGETFLTQIVDRFDMLDWVNGDCKCPEGFEQSQHIEVIEDFFLLLISLLSEREDLLVDPDPDRAVQREIAHVLCFKPLSFSQISARMSDKVSRAKNFDSVLKAMTIYKAPEGTTDYGTFELKQEHFDLVDPFYLYYSRNQREEAEQILKTRLAKKSGLSPLDVVIEPQLPPITNGLFKSLPELCHTQLFTSIIVSTLRFAVYELPKIEGLQKSRIESLVHVVLHLLLIAINEDDLAKSTSSTAAMVPIFDRLLQSDASSSFVAIDLLKKLLDNRDYATCHASIRLIARHLVTKRPEQSAKAGMAQMIGESQPNTVEQDDRHARKQQALDRQARLMASFKQQQSQFMSRQGLAWDDLDADIEMAEGDPESTPKDKIVPYPSEPCMLCQEETNEERLYGSFAFVSFSRFFRRTPWADVDVGYVTEVTDIPESLDRSAEALRPFGVVAFNNKVVTHLTADGTEEEQYISHVSDGFPSDHVDDGPISTSCGHMMHYSCFQNYVTSTERRHEHQIARSHPEDLKRKEFLCPLCKAVGNMFLPVICQGRQEHGTDVLANSPEAYDAWLSAMAKGDFAALDDMMPAQLPLKERINAYIQTRLHPEFRKALVTLSVSSSMSDTSDQSSATVNTTNYQGRASRMLARAVSALSGDASRPTSRPGVTSPSSTTSPAEELADCYGRLHASLQANLLFYEPTNPETLSDTDHGNLLFQTMAYSIAALEIAQRGVETPRSCLSSMSTQNVTNLSLISDAIDTYLAMRKLLDPDAYGQRDDYKQLFCPSINMDNNDLKPSDHFLNGDIFLILAKASVWCPDTWQNSVQHLLRTNYLAYLVQVTTTLMASLTECHLRGGYGSEGTKADLQCTTTFADFCNYLATQYDLGSNTPSYDAEPLSMRLAAFDKQILYGRMKRLIQPYALVFLRKCLMLMYIRHGIDFSAAEAMLDPSRPELERVSSLLQLPDLDDLISNCMSDTGVGKAMRKMIESWTSNWCRDGLPKLDHPAIYELVNLPETYDILTEQAMGTPCPTRPDTVKDPLLCLMCGEIFCGQADCCMEIGKGGAWRHMLACGIEIGLFLAIQKRMIIFLHGRSKGSYIGPAPYLDKYGETDQLARRTNRLRLNQKRYDKLVRDVWLSHGVPSVVSRKLDGESNPGGWDTL